jgi:hypothetical protein
VTLDRKADLFLFGEHEEFYQRRLKSSYVPPPVGRNWRGHKQEPSSIRSNLRFSAFLLVMSNGLHHPPLQRIDNLHSIHVNR